LFAIRDGSVDNIILHLASVSDDAVTLDRPSLEHRLRQILADGKLSPSSKVDHIFNEAQRAGLEISPGYLTVVKAMTTFEGSAQLLKPSFQFETFMKSELVRQSLAPYFGLLLK
jgi:predicted unusual protein kinase regulating ubiquinone biosynthesis (AarF/ABC1/UbiB family)